MTAENKKDNNIILPRRKSLILRTAIAVASILLLSLGISLYFSVQSIDSIARYTYDKDVENSLIRTLDYIKDNHTLQQQLIKERLSVFHQLQPQKNWETQEIQQILGGVLKETTYKPQEIKIEKSSDRYSTSSQPVAITWHDRNTLSFLNFVLTFPKGDLFADFKKVEEIKTRYQIVGIELEKNIRPALIQTNGLILLISFLILFSVFFALANNIKQNLKILLRAFSTWSSEDSNYRIREDLPGELGIIATQFNHMAEDVENNRKRNLHLEKIASWQVIARKLAHEIKNPLTPIQMMVSQLGRRYKGDDDNFTKLLSEAQTIITEEVNALRRMVDSFSDFARLPTPVFAKTDLVETSRHILEMQRATFQQHQFAIHDSPDQLIADVDENLIKQVFKNLLKNAAEACTEPSLIQISLEDTGFNIIIKVKDNGPGIPPDHLAKIFEAYFTTKHTGPAPGMGLGLAIVQKIVLDHKGQISVRNNPSGGTVFTIQLPKFQER